MHELVPQISIHTLHDGAPGQLGSVEIRTLPGKRAARYRGLC